MVFNIIYKWKKSFLGRSKGSLQDFTVSLANYITENNLFVKNKKITYVRIDKYISDVTGLKENNLIRYVPLHRFLIHIIFGGPLKEDLYDIDGVYNINKNGDWSTQ